MVNLPGSLPHGSESSSTAGPGSPDIRAGCDSAISEVHDRFGMKEVPLTTWSSLLTHHAGKFDAQALGTTVLDENFPRRWKLLITVIDCSQSPRLLNPPRSIEALKARLSAAVGIESGDSKARKGNTEATAQTIVTGMQGPERKPLDNDEDLCLFWETIRSGEASSPASPVSRRSSLIGEHAERVATKDARHRGSTELSQSQDISYSKNDAGLLGVSRRDSKLQTSALPKAAMINSTELSLVEEEADNYEKTALEREKELQQLFAENEERCFAAEAKLEDVQGQMEVLQYRTDETEERLRASEEKCSSLQDENLQFIKAFNDTVEQKMSEVTAEVEGKYLAAMQEQGKILAETQSQVKRLQGQLEIRDEKIKDIECSLREQRAAFVKLAAGFEEEKEQFEEERKRLAAKVQRVRQLEFFADCWRRKVAELTDVSGRQQLQQEDSLQYRIGSISIKLDEFQKGRLVQSPEYEVPELGKVQFEFFPTGDVNSREGWCSFRLRVPDQTRLRWSAFIGKKRMGPRTDHFDMRQWWCRYGLTWLNFCHLNDVRSEVLPETDTLLVGIEVHEILANPVEADGDTPVEAAMPIPRDRFGISRHGQRTETPEEWRSPTGSLAAKQAAGPKEAIFPKTPQLIPTAQAPRKLSRPQSVPAGDWKKNARSH